MNWMGGEKKRAKAVKGQEFNQRSFFDRKKVADISVSQSDGDGLAQSIFGAGSYSVTPLTLQPGDEFSISAPSLDIARVFKSSNPLQFQNDSHRSGFAADLDTEPMRRPSSTFFSSAPVIYEDRGVSELNLAPGYRDDSSPYPNVMQFETRAIGDSRTNNDVPIDPCTRVPIQRNLALSQLASGPHLAQPRPFDFSMGPCSNQESFKTFASESLATNANTFPSSILETYSDSYANSAPNTPLYTLPQASPYSQPLPAPPYVAYTPSNAMSFPMAHQTPSTSGIHLRQPSALQFSLAPIQQFKHPITDSSASGYNGDRGIPWSSTSLENVDNTVKSIVSCAPPSTSFQNAQSTLESPQFTIQPLPAKSGDGNGRGISVAEIDQLKRRVFMLEEQQLSLQRQIHDLRTTNHSSDSNRVHNVVPPQPASLTLNLCTTQMPTLSNAHSNGINMNSDNNNSAA